MLSDITMVIFVYGYPKVLVRILEYYAKTNIKIIISDATEVALPEKRLGQFGANVTYIHAPQQSSDPHDIALAYVERIQEATSRICTPFAVMRSNRRHTLISGLYKAREFLKKNPDYVSVQGHVFNIGKDSSKSVTYLKYFLTDVCELDSPFERMKMGMLFYSPIFYALQRADVIKKAWRHMPQTEDLAFNELFHALLTLYYGKHKALPCAYCCNLNRPERLKSAELEVYRNNVQANIAEICEQAASAIDSSNLDLPTEMHRAFLNYYVYFSECYHHLTIDPTIGKLKPHYEKKFGKQTFAELVHVIQYEKICSADTVMADYTDSNRQSMQECLDFFKDCHIE